MSGDSSIISGCRPSATGTQSDSRPSSRWCRKTSRNSPCPARRRSRACRATSSRTLGSAAQMSGGSDRPVLPVRLRRPVAASRVELPGPELRDPLNQADRHRLGQWELERPLAFVWRQLGERLDHAHRLRDRASSVTSTRRIQHADAVQRVGRHLVGQPFLRIRESLENRPARCFEAGSRLFRLRRDVPHRCDALSRPLAVMLRTLCAHRSRSSGSGGGARELADHAGRIYPVGRMERCSAGQPARPIAVCCSDCMRRLRKRCARPARYTGAGASRRHPRPRKGLRPPRHRFRRRQDDLFSCPGERTTGAQGCAVGTAGRGARHDRSPDAPAHSRDAREPRYRSTEATGRELLEAYRAQSPDAVSSRSPRTIAQRRTPSPCTTRSSSWRARMGSRAGRS